MCVTKLKVEEFTEKNETKVEAFETWKFFQFGKKVRGSLGGATTVVISAGKRDLDHWFLCPGGVQVKHTEREIDNRWISFRNPVSH
jgi:hypothetical protein